MTLLLLLNPSTWGTPVVGSDYTWEVQATDEHGIVSAWSTADVFTISQVGHAPVAVLYPWGPSVGPIVTSWGYYDQDGDAQTDYQVQVASDALFASLVQDSGTVTSTNQFYQHATLAAGAYYRRVRVRTDSADWSDYESDTITVNALTAQTDELEIYLDAAGTPPALDQATYPVSGVVLSRRLDGPGEFRFTVDNFDGTEAAIADDDELLVYIKDSAGKRIEFRGGVVKKDVGDLIEVTARDISRYFDRWKVNRWLYNKSIAQIIAACVENPTGRMATGITAHCDEITPTDAPGEIIRAKMFVGGNRTVTEWLNEFAGCTGYRWYIESVAGSPHFYWCNPDAMPAYAATLHDETDRASDSASSVRVKDGFKIARDRENYANKVNYQASLVPPEPPYGYLDYDSWLSESDSLWTAWNAQTVVTQDADIPTSSVAGSKSVKFTYDLTPGADQSWPTLLPLGYFTLPLSWQDQSTLEWGAWRAYVQLKLTLGGVVQTPTNLPQSGVCLFYIMADGSISTPPGFDFNADGSFAVGNIAPGDLRPPWSDWMAVRFSHARVVTNPAGNSVYKHVKAIGLGYYYWGGNTVARESQSQMAAPPTVASGTAIKIELWVDDLMVTSSVPDPTGVDDTASKTPPTIDLSIETAAVTAGTEIPIEVDINTAGLSRSEAGKLAASKLAEINRTKSTVGGLELDGIRNVPLRSLIPLHLGSHGLTGVSWPLAQIEHKLWEAGDVTVLTVGDVPVDMKRSLEKLRTLLKKIEGEVSGT